MNITEVLSRENKGKVFLHKEFGFFVKNNKGTLMWSHKYIKDLEEHWSHCIISNMWLNANYELVD